MSGRRVVVAMPRYGQVELGAAAGYLRPFGKGSPFARATPIDAGSSMTPHAMNQLLAGALDARDAGEADDFAMIHADICPVTPAWLDVLHAERERVGAVAISAFAPIKPHRPRPEGEAETSTAIGDRRDPWVVRHKYSVGDYARSATTITSRDVEGVLLINTGLMLLDLHWHGWDTFAFEWKTRITKRDGRRLAEIRTEDYEMSRYVVSAGAVVAATWAVELDHVGPCKWRNRP